MSVVRQVKLRTITQLESLLIHRRWPLVVAALAAALSLPSLWGGLLMDDYFNRMVVCQPEVYKDVLPHPLDTYNFFDGDPDRFDRAIDRGLFPWWTDPQIRAAFWRPLTSMTQFVDYRLWPSHPWLMHLQSIGWYAALALAVAVLFRRVMGVTTAAGLAALMYAVDEAHGMPVGFLANRNSILACLFGVLSVLMHDRWRRDGNRAMGVAAFLSFAAALLSSEAGIGAMGYLLAYALILDRHSLRRRVASLIPYLVVVIVWRATWLATCHGVRGLLLYTDPLRQPLKYLYWVWQDAVLLITGQYTPLPAEAQAFAWAMHPWMWWIFAVSACLFLWLALAMVRADRMARFLGLGALLALLPVGATLPQSRNLIFVGIGAFGLLGLWLAHWSRRSEWRRLTKGVAMLLIVFHLVISPLLFPVMALYPISLRSAMQTLNDIPGMRQIEGRDLVLVNHPVPLYMLHFLGNRAVNDDPLPAHTRILAHALSSVTVTCTSRTQVRVRCQNGFPDLLSCSLGALPSHLRVGDRIKMTGMEVEITATDKTGMPIEANFNFDSSLHDASLIWVKWSDGAFQPFNPPAVGQNVTLPSIELPYGYSGTEYDALIRRALLNRYRKTKSNRFYQP